MELRWPFAALTVAFTLMPAAPAAAQTGAAALVGPIDRPVLPSTRVRPPEFRAPEGDLRDAGAPRRSGLIAAVPINRNLQIGIGRFRVNEIARPRTNTERERHPAAVGPRQRSIAGIGFSLSFD